MPRARSSPSEHFRLRVFGVDVRASTDDVISRLNEETSLAEYTFEVESRTTVKGENCSSATIFLTASGPPLREPLPQKMGMRVPDTSAYFTMWLERARGGTPRKLPARQPKASPSPSKVTRRVASPPDPDIPSPRPMPGPSRAPATPTTPTRKDHLRRPTSNVEAPFGLLTPQTEGRDSASPLTFRAPSFESEHHDSGPRSLMELFSPVPRKRALATVLRDRAKKEMERYQSMLADDALLEARRALGDALNSARGKHVERPRLIVRALDDAEVRSSALALSSAARTVIGGMRLGK